VSSLWSAIDTAVTSPLFRRALLQAVLVGGLGGVVGVHVSLRRLSFTTMALTHATFPGVVAASLLGWNLVAGSALFGVMVVVALAALGRVRDLDESNATGVVLAGGVALGVMLASTQEGFTRDLSAFLVGSVISTSRSDLVVTALWGGGLLVVLAVLHRPLLVSAFDPLGARAAGLAVGALDVAMLAVVMVAVAVMVPSVGTILAVALLVAPAAAARIWTDRVGVALVAAPAVGSLCGAIGVVISLWVGTAAGATIAVVCGVVLGGSVVARAVLDRAGARAGWGSPRGAVPESGRWRVSNG
jgi:ABC-type Mn2+/Zn2+ transport system permease subunit